MSTGSILISWRDSESVLIRDGSSQRAYGNKSKGAAVLSAVQDPPDEGKAS